MGPLAGPPSPHSSSLGPVLLLPTSTRAVPRKPAHKPVSQSVPQEPALSRTPGTSNRVSGCLGDQSPALRLTVAQAASGDNLWRLLRSLCGLWAGGSSRGLPGSVLQVSPAPCPPQSQRRKQAHEPWQGQGIRMGPRRGAQGHLIGDTAAGGPQVRLGDPKFDWRQCRPPFCVQRKAYLNYIKGCVGYSVGLHMTACICT